MATPRVLNLAGGQQVYNKEKVDELISQLAGNVDPATLADNVMRRLDTMEQSIADANQLTSGRLDAMEQTIADANQATSGRLDTMEQSIADANQATSGRLDAMEQSIADALSGSMPSASDADIDDIWED
jgi:hypothetical protein